MSELFPTKFVADVGTPRLSGQSESVALTLQVNGTTVLSERYSPANGQIVVRGLRTVLEAAIYGELKTGTQDHASANVSVTAGSYSESVTLYASRLRNPRDPAGTTTIMAAGDLVAVYDAEAEALITPALYTIISGSVSTVSHNGGTDSPHALGGGINLWIDRTSCPEKAVAVRFLNRYDVPQTMMTVRPLEVKPAAQDQTALMYGQRVRYSVEQQTDYTLRSGRIHSYREYASWADLVTSRRAEVLMGSQWVPILVQKSNITAMLQPQGMQPVEITFRMADPRQGM